MRRRRTWQTLAVAVAAGALWASSPAPVLGAMLTALPLPAALLTQRIVATRTTQSLVSLLSVGLALIVGRAAADLSVGHAGALSGTALSLGMAALLVATARLYFDRPFGGAPLTVLAALVALVAAGRTPDETAYLVAVPTFILVSLFALREGDPGRGPLRSVRGGQWLAFGAGSLLALTLSVSLVSILPSAHRWLLHRALGFSHSKTGFSSTLWLGSMRDMLASDEVVLRLRGERVDYLRGAVFTSYQGGRWSREVDDGDVLIEIARDPDPELWVTDVEIASPDDRYFVPLEAGAAGVPTGFALRDRLGVLRMARGEASKRYWFAKRGDRPAPVASHDVRDRNVPTRWHPLLQKIANEWAGDATTPRQRAEAIATKLSETYAYSLEGWTPRGDPTIDFLTRQKTGHCEYFASAHALLLRSIGIPARVVTGYRVVERSPLQDYFVVRERDAHAWVEAWLPGEGWRTFDPTPAAGAPQARSMAFLPASLDWLATEWERFDDWLAERTIEELALSLVVLSALLPLIRWLRERRARARGDGLAGYRPPSPAVERLLRALRKRGLIRTDNEPVERFAERVAVSDNPWAGEAADALRAYVALRYGGLGDEDDLRRTLHRAASRVR